MNKFLFTAALLVCSGCSYIEYKASPDGSTAASGFEFGTTKALSGVKFDTRADGSRSLSIDSLNSDQVEGLRKVVEGLSLIVEGAAKGAK